MQATSQILNLRLKTFDMCRCAYVLSSAAKTLALHHGCEGTLLAALVALVLLKGVLYIKPCGKQAKIERLISRRTGSRPDAQPVAQILRAVVGGVLSLMKRCITLPACF